MWESRWIPKRGFSEFRKKCVFPETLCIKTAVLKMFSLYTFKTLLDLNSALVSLNFFFIKNAVRMPLLTINFFHVCLVSAAQETLSSWFIYLWIISTKLIIMTIFYLRKALLQIIEQHFLQFYFDVFYMWFST